MPSPFPGMDPWLEQPVLWPDVHNRLITLVGNALGPVLRPRYFVRVEERVYLTEPPDSDLFVGRSDASVIAGARAKSRRARGVAATRPQPEGALVVEVPVPDEVRETYLEVHAAGRGEVVTVLELLSPSNKRPGAGREPYEEKRNNLLRTGTGLVEVDLIRGGDPMTLLGAPRRSDYHVLVSPGYERPRAYLFPFSVRDPVPRFRLPLRRHDDEPELDLGTLLRDLYDVAAYDMSIDYGTDSVPPLRKADRAWADALLRRAGKR